MKIKVRVTVVNDKHDQWYSAEHVADQKTSNGRPYLTHFDPPLPGVGDGDTIKFEYVAKV